MSEADNIDEIEDMLESTETDYCPRCERITDVRHEPIPGRQYDVVCLHCNLIIDVVYQNGQKDSMQAHFTATSSLQIRTP